MSFTNRLVSFTNRLVSFTNRLVSFTSAFLTKMTIVGTFHAHRNLRSEERSGPGRRRGAVVDIHRPIHYVEGGFRHRAAPWQPTRGARDG